MPASKRQGFWSHFWKWIERISFIPPILGLFYSGPKSFEGNQSLFTSLLLIISVGIFFIILFYWGFIKKQVPELNARKAAQTHPITRFFRFTRKWNIFFRFLFVIGLLLALLGGAYLIYRNIQLESKTVVLLTKLDSDEQEDEYQLTNRLMANLDVQLAGFEDIQTIYITNRITEDVNSGSTVARRLGEDYHADIVIWGYLASNEGNPVITWHIENLYPSRIVPLELSTLLETKSDTGEIQSFSLHTKMADGLTGITYFLSGMMRYEAGDYSGALERFNKAISTSDWIQDAITKKSVYYYRGNTYLWLLQMENAFSDYSSIISAGAPTDETDPIEADVFLSALLNRSYLYSTFFQYEDALSDLNHLIELLTSLDLISPDWALAYGNRGNAYRALHQYDLAIADYNQAIALDPDRGAYYSHRCVAYIESDQMASANTDCETAIRLSPDDPIALYNRSGYFNTVGLYSKALTDLDKAIQIEPEYFQAYANRGYTYFQLANYDQSISDSTKAIEIAFDIGAPSDSIYLNRALAYEKKGELALAIKDLTHAIEMAPEVWRYYDRRGYFYAIQGHHQLAILDLQKANQLNPQHADTLNKLGASFYNVGEFHTAIDMYSQAIYLDNQQVCFYVNRALAYTKIGADDMALLDYNQAVALDPTDGETYYSRGTFYLETEQYSKAIADLQRVFELAPESVCVPCTYFKLGQAESRLGNINQAKNDLETALSLCGQDYDLCMAAKWELDLLPK